MSFTIGNVLLKEFIAFVSSNKNTGWLKTGTETSKFKLRTSLAIIHHASISQKKKQEEQKSSPFLFNLHKIG